MSIHAIILDKPNPVVWDRVRREWPINYVVSDSVGFIVSDKAVTLNREIAEMLGMNDESRLSGVVVEINDNWFGYYSRDLWEWLNKAHYG